MEAKDTNSYSKKLYLDIAEKYRLNHFNVKVREFVEGTHDAIVFLLNNCKDETILNKIKELFMNYGAFIGESFVYDEFDNKYSACIDFMSADREKCFELVKIARNFEINPLNKDEIRNVANYIMNTKDIKSKYIKEQINGTHKAILNVLANSKNGNVKRTIMEIISKYVKVDYVRVDMDHGDYYNKVSYLNLPNAIAKKIKELSKNIELEKIKQIEIEKSYKKKEEQLYIDKLDSFKRR